MILHSNDKSLQLSLILLLALALVPFTASAQSEQYQTNSATTAQMQSGQTSDVSDIVKNPDQYLDKQVTVQWKVDRVYSPTTIGLEKDEKHLLVIAVAPGYLPANMKEGDPINVTGVIRDFDKDEFAQQYGTLDYGKAPLRSFEHKPVLVVGGRPSANLEQSQVQSSVERQKPPVPEESAQQESTQQAETPAPADNALPRTASPLPLLGLIGLIATVLGIGMPVLRRD